MKLLIVFLLSAVLLLDCQQNKSVSNDEDEPLLSVKFVDKEFKSDETIYEGDTLFSQMSFRYPVFSGGDESIIERINNYVFSLTQQDFIGEPTDEPKDILELELLANDFFAEAAASTVEGYPHTGAWSFDLETDTLLVDLSSHKLTLIHNYSYYTGGAHPNYYIAISNIDLSTGDTLSNQRLFGNDDLLLSAVKKRFIENEKQDLAEAGYEFNMSDYWFENDTFHLPSAIGFTREGILCIYSPYEVSSYARGAIEFTVPYDDVPHLKLKEANKSPLN